VDFVATLQLSSSFPLQREGRTRKMKAKIPWLNGRAFMGERDRHAQLAA
jgi:hypothetical protein